MLATLWLALLITQGASAQTTNSTQATVIYHGANLYCTPTNWFDVGIFFLGSYLSHALTIKSYPGEATASVLIAAFGALLIPTTGLIRGINAIARKAKFKRKKFLSAVFRDPDYQTAAAAGALCMVVRKKSWKPYPGDKLCNVVLREKSEAKTYSGRAQRRRGWLKAWGIPIFFEVQPIARKNDDPEPVRMLKVYRGPWAEELGRYWADTSEQYVHPSKKIHGLYDFKDQAWSYALAHVPRDAVISVKNDPYDITPRCLESKGTGMTESSSVTAVDGLPGCHTPSSPIIAASYSIPKAVIAIVQLGYAILTLYQSRGNQIEHYGYAAFALTVVPYALMSLVNLLGSLLTPDYQALYLVASDVMDEAIRRGAQFDGVAGRLVQDMDDRPATCEVLSCVKDDKNSSCVEFSYCDQKASKKISVDVADYSSPPLPKRERRKYVKRHLQEISTDVSASVFIPSCSKFHRLDPHNYPTDTNRTQLTPQGSFTFSDQHKSSDWRGITCLIQAGVILAIIGGATRFQAGQATVSQLGWILHWYIFGAVYSGFSIGDFIQAQAWPEPDMGEPSKRDIWVMILPCTIYGIPAIGGFVVVIQMLFDWGSCTFY